MMKSSRLEEGENAEENIIKDVRNLFILTKSNKAIKDKLTRDLLVFF